MGKIEPSYYVAPIALTEDLVEGATVSGTINDVQVSGTVESGYVKLYAIAQVSLYTGSGDSPVAKISGDAGNYQIMLKEQPESDLTIHLTQTIPAHAVTIPEEYLELTETNEAIAAAQTTASTALSTADTAKTTADTAKTTANNAQIIADTAKTTANNAQIIADTAKTTANNAKTTANNAKATANNAKAAADDAYPRAGASELRLKSNNSGLSGNMFFSGKPNEPIYCRVDRSSASDVSAPARFVFAPNGGTSMQVEGINVLQMKSSSGKIFNITVDDTGAIKATEVTNN